MPDGGGILVIGGFKDWQEPCLQRAFFGRKRKWLLFHVIKRYDCYATQRKKNDLLQNMPDSVTSFHSHRAICPLLSVCN